MLLGGESDQRTGVSEMTNKSAPTQRQKSERARRIAMGIAVIQRPLRLIKRSDATVYEDVLHIANSSDGAFVKGIARRYL